MKTYPIDIGDARLGSYSFASPYHRYTRDAAYADFATACYFEGRWPQNDPPADETSVAAVPTYIESSRPDPDDIHNQVQITSSSATAGFPDAWWNLYFYNPIGYEDKQPEDIIEDLIEHQAHVGLGTVRLMPTGDGAIKNWTQSGGTPGSHYTNVDGGTHEVPPSSPYLWTGTKGTVERLTFYNQAPSNVSKVKEITVRFWLYVLESGTGQGLSVFCDIWGTSGQIGIAGKHAMAPGDVSSERYIELKWEGLDISKAELDTFLIQFEADRQYDTGATSYWRIAVVDVDVLYETTDIDLVDNTSFDNLNAYYSGKDWDLKGDFVNKTFAEAVLEVLDHAPLMYLALDSESKLRAFHVPTNLQQASADHELVYGESQTGLVSLVETDDWRERFSTSGKVSYGTFNDPNSPPGEKDHINTGFIDYYTDEEKKYLDLPERRPVDRELMLFTSAPLVRAFVEEEASAFSETIDLVLVETNWVVFMLLDGDSIMKLVIPEETIDKNYLVADVEINLDDMSAEIAGLAVTV